MEMVCENVDETLENALINDYCISKVRKISCDIAESDHERAKRLLEICIDAGDKRYSTNILALLIQEDDPERATKLFEEAIAAGGECFAASNLAYLIKDIDPEKARDLYERSILAGNPIRFDI